TAGTVTIGGTNASALTLGRTGLTVSIPGALSVTQAATITGSLAANGGITTGGASINAGAGTITSGAINGQTISVAASFTGTVTAATGLTVSAGGIAVTGNSTIAGSLGSVTSLSLSGAISGGTTYSGSGDITSTGGQVVAATHTGSGAVTVSSGGAAALTLISASGTAILGGSTNTIQRTNATLALDVVNAGAASTLNVTNSNGSQVANLDVEGGLNIGSGQTYKIGSTDINTAGTLTNVAYKNQANIFTAAQSLQITSSSALLIQNNAGGATLLTADTSGMIIKVATAAAATQAGTDLLVADAEFSGALRVGDGTNSAQFDGTSKELTFSGTARHAKKVELDPEYPGVTFTPDGTANVGTLNSDFCSGTGRLSLNIPFCNTASDNQNYYSWTSASGTNDYDLYIRYTIPSDYSGSPTFSMFGWRSSASDSTALTLLKEDATSCITATTVGGTVWTDTPLTNTCSFSANERVIFRIKLTAVAGEFALAGKVTFNYSSRW
ncbi:MAG TPA: hypothetical protein VMR98_04655, partial [Candidatus Polarisedimenticolaceae bacterium]|nr:hypothetical protein [Candidatus Polarisedimenticolaceae bacterium]